MALSIPTFSLRLPRRGIRRTSARRRGPVALFTPQPVSGKNGDKIVDVLVHGGIRSDGKVHGAVVDSSPGPNLNAEALQLISTWKFLPMICNGNPATVPTDLVLHSQGR